MVTISADGTINWNGGRFVQTVGAASSKISPERVKELVGVFEQAGYFSLKDSYTAQGVTDMPSANTSITMNGQHKAVQHYYGDSSAPEQLKQVEDKIDEIANTAQWIGQGIGIQTPEP